MAYIVSVAGSDSSGGAGNQADVSCIEAFGQHALSVITAIVAQDAQGVHHIASSDTASMQAQLKVVFSSFNPGAVKSGLLPTKDSIEVLAASLKSHTKELPYVLDPVMSSSSGAHLISDETVPAMIQHLFPITTVVTPNIPEAERFTGRSINTTEEMVDAGKSILELGCPAVVITGGHAKIDPGVDMLLDTYNADTPHFIRGIYIADRSPRGTGCTFASAIACGLASHLSLYEATVQAKHYLSKAIATASQVESNYWLLNHRVAVGDE